MYSSKINYLLEANKASMSSTTYSIEQRESINGMGYDTKDESHVDDDDADEYENNNACSEDIGGPSDQIYLDRLSALKNQLQSLHDGTHKEFNRRKKDILALYTTRIKLNEEWRDYQLTLIDKEYETETRAAAEEFDEKKAELRENMLIEMEDKKRIIEQERYSLDLSGDSMEYKPVSTRKLRRRGNEPEPVVEKRRKTIANSLDAILDDKDIEDDLSKIYKTKLLNVRKNKPSLDYPTDNSQNRKQRLSGPSNQSFRHPSPSSSPNYMPSKNDGHVLTRSGMSRTIR